MTELEEIRQKIAKEEEAEIVDAVDLLCKFQGYDRAFVLTAISRMGDKLGYTPREALKKRFGIDLDERRKNKKMQNLKDLHKNSKPSDFAPKSFSAGGEHLPAVKAGIERGKRLKEAHQKYGQVPYEEREKYQGDPETGGNE